MINLELYNGPCLHTQETAQRLANKFSKDLVFFKDDAIGHAYFTIIKENDTEQGWRVTNRFDPRVSKQEDNNV